jgi:hypothetical protein
MTHNKSGLKRALQWHLGVLPKQQSTNFWSQGILGVNICAHLFNVRFWNV